MRPGPTDGWILAGTVDGNAAYPSLTDDVAGMPYVARLACDLAVSASHARYFLPEGNVGMWPMLVGALLRRVVGERVALDLALTGRRLDCAEALRPGTLEKAVACRAQGPRSRGAAQI